MYSDEILKSALESERAGITANGIPINNNRYADDTVILAESLEDLQKLVEKVKKHGEDYVLTLNMKRTRFIKISKSTLGKKHIKMAGHDIERVERYTYHVISVNSTFDTYSENFRLRYGNTALPRLLSMSLSDDSRTAGERGRINLCSCC